MQQLTQPQYQHFKRKPLKMDTILDDFQMKDFSEISPKDYMEEECGINFDFEDEHFLPSQMFQRKQQNKHIKQRVSDKLNQNRLRKMELQLEKEQEKINIINKRRERFQQLNQFLQQKNLLSEKAKQNNIRSHDPQISHSKNQQECQSPITHANNLYNNSKSGMSIKQGKNGSASQKNINIASKINQHRQKAQEIKNTYAFRIHKKNQERISKVNTNKKEMEQNQMRKTNKIHLQQWKNYQSKLKQKIYQGNSKQQINPPDFLYQKHKEKQNKLQMLARKHLKGEDIEQKPKKVSKRKPFQEKFKVQNEGLKIQLSDKNQPSLINNTNVGSLPSILISKRTKNCQKQNKTNPLQKIHSIQYFGLHSVKNHIKSVQTRPRKLITQKTFEKIKKYIFDEKNLLINNLEKDQKFLDNFQIFLAKQDEPGLLYLEQEEKNNTRTRNRKSEKNNKLSAINTKNL